MSQSIAWSDDLLVDVPLIDGQHRELYASMDALLAAVNGRHSGETIEERIGAVLEHTVSHCRDEEALMLGFEYPGLEPQKKDHDYFSREIKTIGERFRSGSVSGDELSKNLVKLADFFSVHIRKLDAALGRFVNERTTESP